MIDDGGRSKETGSRTDSRDYSEASKSRDLDPVIDAKDVQTGQHRIFWFLLFSFPKVLVF